LQNKKDALIYAADWVSRKIVPRRQSTPEGENLIQDYRVGKGSQCLFYQGGVARNRGGSAEAAFSGSRGVKQIGRRTLWEGGRGKVTKGSVKKQS